MMVDPMDIPSMITGVEANWLTEVSQTKHEIVEIGSWQGSSTVSLACKSQAKIWCIDPWQTDLKHPEYGYGEESYQAFLKHVDEYRTRIRVLRMTSFEGLEWIRVLAQPDMIYIDGDHSYRSVQHDIEVSLGLLKSGGLLCGHDYNKNSPGVIQAVAELVPEAKQLGGYVFGLWYYEIP